MTLKNAGLRALFRCYPFQKGRYRLMKACLRFQDKEPEVTVPVFGNYRLFLNLAAGDLQSSFYYFMPESYEAGTQEFIRSLLKPGMVALDVGAHIGLMTLLMARCVGPRGKVFSFEPENENFSRLKKNIDGNNLSWVRLFQLALADQKSKMALSINRAGSGHALQRVLDTPCENEISTQWIDALSLDEILESESVPHVDLLKIDAEKSEHLVLKGAERALSKRKIANVICEIHSSHKQGATGQDKIRKILYSYGFKSYVLNSRLSKKRYLSELKPDEPLTGLQNLGFRLDV